MSSLYNVCVISLDLPSNSCTFTVEAVNNEDQTTPSEAGFYGNLLSDLYLISVLNLSPPIAYLKEGAVTQTIQAQGVEWFWAYAMRYLAEDREEIMARCAEFGPPSNIASEYLDTLDDVMWEGVDDLPNSLKVEIERQWRNEYNSQIAQVKLTASSETVIEFLTPGLSLSTVYGPDPTWDVL